MLYAQGAYITSSKILKEFNLLGPAHLQTASSKDLFLRSLNAAGQNDSLKVYQGILASKKSSIKKPTTTSLPCTLNQQENREYSNHEYSGEIASIPADENHEYSGKSRGFEKIGSIRQNHL